MNYFSVNFKWFLVVVSKGAFPFPGSLTTILLLVGARIKYLVAALGECLMLL